MRKILSITLFILLVCSFQVYSEEKNLSSEVTSINLEQELFMISSGKDIGIEMGDNVIVSRGDEKIAEGYVIGVKENISAIEISKLEKDKEIIVGDKVAVLKKSKKVDIAQEKPVKKPTKVVKKSKWTVLGGRSSASLGSRPSKSILSKWGAKSVPRGYTSDVTEKAQAISVSIDKDTNTVFSYARLVLKENGYSITSSNRATGILLATKPLKLSLLNELWADAIAAIDHNIVASFDVKKEGDSSSLTVSFFKEHSQKGKHIKRPIMMGSKYYSEFKSLASEIKKRSEY